MSKGDLLEMERVIQDALGGGQYTIKVDQGGAMVRAQLSGRMRRHHIRVLPGDKVRVAVSPYDLSHGPIVYRGRSWSGAAGSGVLRGGAAECRPARRRRGHSIRAVRIRTRAVRVRPLRMPACAGDRASAFDENALISRGASR